MCLFFLGIGDDADHTELKAISSEPAGNFVYFVSNFTQLTTIETVVAKTTCGKHFNIICKAICYAILFL